MGGPGAIAAGPEDSVCLLLCKPAKELLKLCVRPDLLDCIEGVSKLIVAPGFVDEILA